MRFRTELLVAALVVVLDQLTKAWVANAFPLGGERQVIPGLFRLVHTRNRGIAFGLLGTSGPTVQIGLLVVIVAIVLVVARQLGRTNGDALTACGLALILGGALGNLVDRVVRGEVVDFLDFYLGWGGREHHWPSFNLADSAISVGACCVILAELFVATRRKRASSPH